MGAGLFDLDKLHWTLVLGILGAAGGFLISLVNAATILWPTPKTIDAAAALTLPVAVLFALAGVAFLEGNWSIFRSREFSVLLAGAAVIGGVKFLLWRLSVRKVDAKGKHG